MDKNLHCLEFDGFDYNRESGELTISFNAHNCNELFGTNQIKLVYLIIKPSCITVGQAVDIFCSVVMPHTAAHLDYVKIKAPLSKAQQQFWPWYIEKLMQVKKKKAVIEIDAESTVQDVQTKQQNRVCDGGRSGLFFGGGVESLACLSQLIAQRPLLLSLTGPAWMNNDYKDWPLKRKMEDELITEFKLEIARIWHNLKEILTQGDEYINMFVTGGFMYYSIVPVAVTAGLQMIFHSMELEYSLVNEKYDRSIHPKFSHITARRGLPPLISMFNSVPKIELLEMLYSSSPRLCSYLYSCLRNTDKRWCGQCGKCRRISAFCEAIGIPKSHIQMPENIQYGPEKGQLTKLYWKNLERYKSGRRNRKGLLSLLFRY